MEGAPDVPRPTRCGSIFAQAVSRNILSAPGDAAQRRTDGRAAAGACGMANFLSACAQVPSRVHVNAGDTAAHLEQLSVQVSNANARGAPAANAHSRRASAAGPESLGPEGVQLRIAQVESQPDRLFPQ